MKNLFKNLGERKFRYISAVLSFLGDLALVIYIYLMVADFSKFKALFNMAAQLQGMSTANFPVEMIREQFYNAMNSVKFMLGALLFIQFVVYVMHALKSVPASKYLKFSLIITILTSALLIKEAWEFNKIFAMIFLLLVPTYIFCYQGIKYFHLNQRLPKNREPKKSPDHFPPKKGEV